MCCVFRAAPEGDLALPYSKARTNFGIGSRKAANKGRWPRLAQRRSSSGPALSSAGDGVRRSPRAMKPGAGNQYLELAKGPGHCCNRGLSGLFWWRWVSPLKRGSSPRATLTAELPLGGRHLCQTVIIHRITSFLGRVLKRRYPNRPAPEAAQRLDGTATPHGCGASETSMVK